MDDTDVKISFLLCAYNSSKTITECINALLQQEFDHYEIVVIDDGSEDDTWAILQSFNDDRMRLYHKLNTGLTKSLNFGLAKCRGKYIARIDADDICKRNRLRLQYNAATENKFHFVASSYTELNASTKVKKEVILSKDVTEHVRTLQTLGTPFHHSTMFFNKDFILENGGYDISFVTGQDFELWQRLITPDNTTIVTEPLVEVTVGQSQSITGRRTILSNFALHWRVYFRAWQGNFFLATYHSINSIKPLRQLVKKCLK